MKPAKTFNDLYSDVTITYYRISSATIGYARFGLNYINKLLELLNKLIYFKKNERFYLDLGGNR